ncbi:MAG: DUF6134 family protein [Pseudomonadota bacterium]
MMETTRKKLQGWVALCLLLAAGYVNGAEADGASAARKWMFKVYLNDKPIGFHNFEVEDAASGTTLTTNAEFDVKVLFINAFRYRHSNVETWRDDCLIRIDARTNSNGNESIVAGVQSASLFNVSTSAGQEKLNGCVQTFAYWNPAILQSSRLLNSQTGDYEQVSVEFDGRDSVAVDGVEVPADRYTLMTKGGDVTLWYSADDWVWLALEAPAKGGRTLRYEPVSVPATVTDSIRVAGAN